MEMLLDVIIDTCLDCLKMLPFLFVAFSGVTVDFKVFISLTSTSIVVLSNVTPVTETDPSSHFAYNEQSLAIL